MVMAAVPKCTEEGAISPFSAGSRGLYPYYSWDSQNFLTSCNVFQPPARVSKAKCLKAGVGG